jgi:hypothetical protein
VLPDQLDLATAMAVRGRVITLAGVTILGAAVRPKRRRASNLSIFLSYTPASVF